MTDDLCRCCQEYINPEQAEMDEQIVALSAERDRLRTAFENIALPSTRDKSIPEIQAYALRVVSGTITP